MVEVYRQAQLDNIEGTRIDVHTQSGQGGSNICCRLCIYREYVDQTPLPALI